MWEQAGVGPLAPADVASRIANGADSVGATPLDSPTASYSYDGDREGVLSAGGALAAAP
jgi:hypothetical protein